MKTFASIHGLASGVRVPGTGGIRGISKELIEQLCAVFPEGRAGSLGHSFHATLPIDDPRTQAILTLLENHGLRAWQSPAEKTDNDYIFTLKRVYDEADLGQHELLELNPPYDSKVKSLYRNGPGVGPILVDAPLQFAIGFAFRPSCIVIQEHVRMILASAELRNLVFRPTEIRFEPVDYDLYDEEAVYWELRSDVLLPPLSPSTILVHRDHSPFTGDFARGCMRMEGFYNNPELHYRRDDLSKVAPFDLAHTYEMFHGGTMPSQDDRPLVASKRFYEVCKQHNIKTGWVPVRVED
jgi:hypothetical protein